ncbi:MAG: TonB-dependent receptor plug domain-containing protein, partial [Gemmatimonadota bacterium]
MLRAQIPPDSIGKVDSVPVDTSNLDETSRYLAAQAKGAHQMSVLSQLGVEGPRPGYSRLEFNQDSLAWAGSETLGDLLRSVPDVYVLRAGWIGRSEYLDYAGRGSTSVEYYQDGMPLIPIGPDSVAVDPSFQPLSLLQRVVIERWPGVLRVLLYTRQHDRQAPASRIGISTGDRQYARYIGALEYRLGKGWDISFG